MDPIPVPGRTCLAIVLAAGESSRMCSARPKVLHELAGRSMLAHVLNSLVEAGAQKTVVVAGPNHDAVMAEAKTIIPDARTRDPKRPAWNRACGACRPRGDRYGL